MQQLSEKAARMIDEAKAFAEKAHAGVTRRVSNEPFVNHPIRVAEMVNSYVSAAAVAAAYLHDVVEDTKYKDLSQFPSRVRSLVRLLTRIPDEEKTNMIRRIGLSMDEEGILIKVADRIDNLRDGSAGFGVNWLKKYLRDAELLYGFAVEAGLSDHKIVKLLRSEIDRLQKTIG